MKMRDVLAFLGILPAVIVALAGWYVVDGLAAKRDVQNERRETRTKYVIDSYRAISAAAGRRCLSEEEKLSFEAAISDMLLLGSPEQIATIYDQIETNTPNWTLVLSKLREDLRKELEMPPEHRDVVFFRYPRPVEHCLAKARTTTSSPPTSRG